MRRRGSGSFVVEVKRRRFQNVAPTSHLDRKNGLRINPIGAGGVSATPLFDREREGDPAIEAAKIAARQFFTSSPQSPRAVHWSDPGARGFVPRVEPARPADVAVQKPAADAAASPPPQPNGQADKPRSGRILQGLSVEDPIDALLRQEAEEKLARRRPRGPRVRRVVPVEADAPTSSQKIHDMAAKPGTAEPTVSTDIAGPGRKLRGATAVTEQNPVVDTPTAKTTRRRKKKATKAPRRAGSLRRTANGRAGAKRRAQKRASSRSLGKKGVAKRAVAKRAVAKKDAARKQAGSKHAGKSAVAKKTAVRKTAAKKPIGRPTVAKKRSAARRTVTTAAGRKVTSGRVAKTKRSAAAATKTVQRSRKPAAGKARRSR
jgi:hypothetical protein